MQQVEAMKEMVNAFSEYARAPRFEMSSVELNKLVTEVAELYRAQDTRRRVRLTVTLDPGIATVIADQGGCGNCCTTCSPTRSRHSKAAAAARSW